jgi:hypothetical protein
MRLRKSSKPWLLAIALLTLTTDLVLTPANATSPIDLASAANYQILSGTALTVGTGTIGLAPQFDGVSASAVVDLQAAIASAASLSATEIEADLGENTFTPGIYKAIGGAAFAMTGNVILNGQGKTDPIFLFFTPAAMNTTAGAMTFLNGAQPKDVYWAIGGAITTGAGGKLVGTFMSSAAITIGAGSTVSGCLLAVAAVTIGAANIFIGCSQSDALSPTGALSISVPTIFQIPDSRDGISATGELGAVTVTDSRSGSSATSWSVTVEATSLTDGLGNTIPPTAISYLVGHLQIVGAVASMVASRSPLFPSLPALSVSGSGGVNSANWLAQVIVTIPPGQAAGSYAGTLTHSVF